MTDTIEYIDGITLSGNVAFNASYATLYVTTGMKLERSRREKRKA
jgi:hypothetical protein